MSELDESLPTEQEIAKALDVFASDLGDVEKLQDALSQFNIFEAVGATTSELKHSNFLGWLLNPNESHGLGDLFVRRFLQQALLESEIDDVPLSPLAIASLELGDCEIQREWQNIDILVTSQVSQLSVVIENKILAGESRDQLKRYRAAATAKSPNFRHLFLFLSIEGTAPTDQSYIPVSYDVVADLIMEIVDRKAEAMPHDIVLALRHYEQLLRRHYVSNSELRNLALAVYRKHQRALDFIFDNRPDRQSVLGSLIEERLRRTPGLKLDDCSKVYKRFLPIEWTSVEPLKTASHWTKSGHGVMFEILNLPDRVRVGLTIGPMEADLRLRSLELLSRLARPGGGTIVPNLSSPRYSRVWAITLLMFKDKDESPAEEIMERLEPKLDEFVSSIIPQFRDALASGFAATN